MPFRSLRALLALPLVALLAACGGEASQAANDEPAPPDPATACLSSSPAPVALAVRDFITTAEPTPLRFLNAATTDSALPPLAAAVVQDKGPTFYWMPDEKSRQQVRDNLSRVGAWASMLVVVREDTDHGDGTKTVRVGGHYIGPPHEGIESPEKRYTISCRIDSLTSWTITHIAGPGAP